MSYEQKIRKNPKTMEWEHYVAEHDGQPGYWFPGLYGKLFTSNGKELIPDQQLHDTFNNPSNNISLYDTLNTGIVYTNINTISNLNPKSTKEMVFTELIDLNSEANQNYAPNILNYNFKKDFQIVYNTNFSASVIVYNPIPENELKYNWYMDGKKLKINNSKLTVLMDNIDTPVSFKCEIDNTQGKNSTKEIQIKSIDLNNIELIGKNLIKNYDAITGMDNWNSISGMMTSYKPYNANSRVGIGDSWTAFVGSSQDPLYLQADKNIGPYPDKIIKNWKYESMFSGGVINDNKLTEAYYDIDLSNISDIIDRKILNVKDVYAKLFAYIGSWGQRTFFKFKNKSDTHYQAYNFDRIYISVDIMDENNNIINKNNFIYNPYHARVNLTYFLRSIDFYIPISARKLRIKQKYEPFYNYTIETKIINNIINTNPIDPLPDLNRGYSGIRNNEYINDHLTTSTLINCTIFIDNYIKNKSNIRFNEFNKYVDIFNKTDEYNNYISIDKYYPPFDLVYSSLFDKINDLKLLGITDNSNIIKELNNSEFIINKYYDDEISTSVQGTQASMNNLYNLRKQNNTIYYKK